MRHATLALLLAACGSAESPATKPAPAPAPTPSPTPTPSPVATKPATPDLDPRFVDTIRAAAPVYRSWGLVDGSLNAAALDCSPPPMPARVRMSAAADAPHGQKLYYLWASDRAAYLSPGPIKPGFAVVKEAFAAVPSTAAAGGVSIDNRITTVRIDGKSVTTGDATGLFVMAKVGARDGSDAGWVYGTIAADGTVTSAGRVANCMGCHEASATHERLFGLAR